MDGCGCAFDNNGRALAHLTPDGRLKIWDCTAGSLKHEFTPPSHLSSSCSCLKWSRTSRSVVSKHGPKSACAEYFLKRIILFAVVNELRLC